MKKYRISVNGTTYEVEVEELEGGQVSSTPTASSNKPAAASKPAPKKKAAPKKPKQEKKQPAPAPTGGGETVEAPMPGTVLSIKVSEGDTVSAGDTLLILEAMKMENEVNAPCDGTVSAINVSEGASVNTGDVLVSIE